MTRYLAEPWLIMDTSRSSLKKVGEDTAFAKIIELVEEAQESKAKTQKFLEKFASFYTPAILALSVIVFLFTRNIELTLTFLVVACPGALVISAPVSIVAGIGNGAKSGVLIKGGETMEHLSKINAVVFDKTGTLTKGRPEVTAIKAYRMEEELLLTRLAEAEVVSEHHLGRTIVQEALNRGLSLVRQPSDVEIAKGNGIKAVIEGETWAIGNRKWMGIHSVRITDEVDAYAIEQEKQGNTAIFAAAGTDIMGVISIADQVRAEARESIRRLKDNGVKQIYMLTGDNRHTAEKVAKQLGIDQVFSELLPADKVAKIKELKALGHKVAMVGDGINDAPAIAAADVGLAMGGTGTDAAMETADVVLMAGKLDQLVHACKLSKATVRNMKQNMFFAVSVVMILLAGVLTEHIFLASGMFIHELSVLLIIVNAIRLVGYNRHQRGDHRHESMRSARPGRIKC
ncbi:heavy metal translocating P-type ATPase [Paenibacillus sp. DMB20]|uniref:heavy metal translocating P-type ATPase n=1 Tax=Paenibacillus sp. DMB20 TaxID=1642570 RepID=UPI00268EDCC3